MDASFLTNRRKNRVNFAYFVEQRERQEKGCILRFSVESGSGSSNPTSAMISIENGATETTRLEEETYLAQAATCVPDPVIAPVVPPTPPSGLPSASLWFDASDVGSLSLAGPLITAFTDKTGNGNDGVAYNGEAIDYNVAPINGLGTVRIDNTDPGRNAQLLKVTNYNFNDDYLTYAFVINYISGDKGFVATDTPGLYGRGIGADNGQLQTISYDSFDTWNGVPNITIPQNTPSIIVASISAGDWTVSVNGTQYTLPLVQAKTPDNTEGLNIGCWNPGNYLTVKFDIGELLVYTSFLTPSQIQQVEAYFAAKWGLQGVLPAGHPGK